MNRKKIGIATVFSGYNYGSALQAYAVKQKLYELGYDGEVLKLSGSLIRGRDVRFSKLIVMLLRILQYSRHKKAAIQGYGVKKYTSLSQESKTLFHKFFCEYIFPNKISYYKLKQLAMKTDYHAFVCGSDQVWNSTTFYVDPFYYLQFAPQYKRIAFAPSFGRDYIAEYNKHLIGKYIASIPYKSVRERSGIKLIKDLTAADAIMLPDPTLLFSMESWVKILNLSSLSLGCPRGYILAYFLDQPSEVAQRVIEQLRQSTGYAVVVLPSNLQHIADSSAPACGPREFLKYIQNAQYVCTDSFHGTAFSVNFHVPFYTFERNYGTTAKQSTRILSLLESVQLLDRYEPTEINTNNALNFDYADSILQKVREQAKTFLSAALEKVGEHDKHST